MLLRGSQAENDRVGYLAGLGTEERRGKSRDISVAACEWQSQAAGAFFFPRMLAAKLVAESSCCGEGVVENCGD